MRRMSVALLGLGVIARILAGCSNSGSCKSACNKIAQCMGIDPGQDVGQVSSWSCPQSDACTVTESCMAKCVNKSSCQAITGEDITTMQDLLVCQEQCRAVSVLDSGLQDSIQEQDRRSPKDGTPHSPKDGTPLSPPDQATPLSDTGPLTTGVIIITEMMPNPSNVSDANGEWFELYNADGQTIDLNGWTIQDSGGATHLITKSGGLLIKPGQYLVLGLNSDTLVNGGVLLDYDYSFFTMNNDSDQLLLSDSGGVLVDAVTYTPAWGITAGVSVSLINPSLDNADSSNWCRESTSWSGSAGDKGSPGTAAGCI